MGMQNIKVGTGYSKPRRQERTTVKPPLKKEEAQNTQKSDGNTRLQGQKTKYPREVSSAH